MPTPDQKLQAYYHFDDADLDANRSGGFSESQRARLVENDRKIQRRWGWRSVPFLLIAAVGPVLALAPGNIMGTSWKVIWGFVWTGIWGAIGLIMLGSFLSRPKALVLAKVTGKVNMVREGSYRASTRTHSSEYQLHIGRHAFDMDEELTDILMNGDEVTAYYERDWNEIVSVERGGKT